MPYITYMHTHVGKTGALTMRILAEMPMGAKDADRGMYECMCVCVFVYVCVIVCMYVLDSNGGQGRRPGCIHTRVAYYTILHTTVPYIYILYHIIPYQFHTNNHNITYHNITHIHIHTHTYIQTYTDTYIHTGRMELWQTIFRKGTSALSAKRDGYTHNSRTRKNTRA